MGYKKMNRRKLTVCVDFDGVLNNYEYYDPNNCFTPRPGAKEFLEKLSEKYHVVILTARSFPKVERWLKNYGLNKYVADVTNIKVPAVAYIDDRAIKFKGDYDFALKELENFKPYWKEE